MRRALGAWVVLFLVAISCGGPPKIDVGDPSDYSVTLGPGDFVSVIDNEWLPWAPGSRWVYESRGGGAVEHIEVEVLDDTRMINGVIATVVRDTVSVNGELIEDTFDWYAQDTEGNVWYLGEASTEYENGVPVGTSGSWEWGVDGALPGILMWADPQVGAAYRQEFYRGEAEDTAEVVRRGETVTVPYGTFEDVLVIKEWNPLERRVVEEKYYAAGFGVIMEKVVEGGSEIVELIEVDIPG